LEYARHTVSPGASTARKNGFVGPAQGRRECRTFSETTRVGRGVLPRIMQAYDLSVYWFIVVELLVATEMYAPSGE
jgi:hypothetical protein